jgi:hypothetical protein
VEPRRRSDRRFQYWFYYPFNEWINRHEGDWERIQVILRGPSRMQPGARFTPVAHQYFFHGWWTQPQQLVHLAGDDQAEDHPLVYVGGRGHLLAWSGIFSGGSYPLPALYRQAGFGLGPFNPDEDVSAPARFIAARDFQVIVLPEPERLDARRQPQLSWLRLPFYAGQRSVYTNPPGYHTFGQDQPPLQPAARRSWLEVPRGNRWSGTIRRAAPEQQPPRTEPWRAAAAALPDRIRLPGESDPGGDPDET